MTADDDMHDKHGLPPRPPQLGRDEGLREAAELLWCAAHGTLPAEARLRGYLDGPEQQAEVRAVNDLLSRLPLLTAERQDDLDAAYDQGAREWAEMHRQLAEQLREARERADRLDAEALELHEACEGYEADVVALRERADWLARAVEAAQGLALVWHHLEDEARNEGTEGVITYIKASLALRAALSAAETERTDD